MNGHNEYQTHLQFTRKCLLLKLFINANFCKFLIRMIVSLLLGQKLLFVTVLKITFMGKSLFTPVIFTKISGL